MKASSFQLSNVLGSVYQRGPLAFSPDGRVLVSPTGNRVSLVELHSQRSRTLPMQTRKPIALVALCPPRPHIALVVDVDGRAQLLNINAGATLAHVSFGGAVRAAQFSPDGRFLAVALGSQVKVWRTPNTLAREFSPFVLHRTYTGHHDDVLSIQWNKDGT